MKYLLQYVLHSSIEAFEFVFELYSLHAIDRGSKGRDTRSVKFVMEQICLTAKGDFTEGDLFYFLFFWKSLAHRNDCYELSCESRNFPPKEFISFVADVCFEAKISLRRKRFYAESEEEEQEEDGKDKKNKFENKRKRSENEREEREKERKKDFFQRTERVFLRAKKKVEKSQRKRPRSSKKRFSSVCRTK
ncbi:hypothetical protein RUM44_008238 [Polyplax serrata]|uniref:Uncharacterized protein n=1 Tax=Polyplax serrata TaxID=468196 RepID=A0ABR1B7W8_POLSC